MDELEYKVGDTVTIHQKITGDNRMGVKDCILIENSPVFVKEMDKLVGNTGAIIKITEYLGRKRYRVQFQNPCRATWWFAPESFKQKDFTKRNLILSKINKKPIPQG